MLLWVSYFECRFPKTSYQARIVRYSFLLLLFLPAVTLRGQNLPNSFDRKESNLTDGLIHQQFGLKLDKDTVRVNVLIADLRKISIVSVLAKDQVIGQETVSSMVERSGALAGVNGGFSFSNDPWNNFHGDPRDLFVEDGKILSEPLSTRSSFAILEDQKPYIGRFQWEAYLIHGEDSIRIDGINRQREEGEVILYTPEFSRTTMTSRGSKEWICRNGSCNLSLQGSNLIPIGGFVISVAPGLELPARFDSRVEGVRLVNSLVAEGLESNQSTPEYVWTAGPALLKRGEVDIDFKAESIDPSFGSTRHPRTGVGFDSSGEKLWLVTVDGRQEGWSAGISLDDLAELFMKLSATEAYNLDGGGSTTMAIGGEVVNRFSDPKERRRCDAVVLFKK